MNQTKEIYLHSLLMIFVGIVFVIFLLSTITIYTTWFDSNTVDIFLKNTGLCGHASDVWLFSSLILIVFLIAQARYSITRNGQTEIKKMQLFFGFLFASSLIVKVLFFYYANIYAEKLSHELSFHKTISAKNDVIDAHRVYLLHGEKSKYFDVQGNVHLYEPPEDVVDTRKMIEQGKAKRHFVPIYLVIIFMSLIFSYQLGTWLAKKNNGNKDDS